jgi:hypothetical protein
LKVAIDKEKDSTNAKEISTFLTKALIEKDNHSMGIKITQLVVGRDIAIEKSVLNPIQSKLYEFAAHMKNIIHIIVDIETKKCVIVDAVSTICHMSSYKAP